MSEILDRYDTILLDAQGVLINSKRALPYACELIDYLNSAQYNYYVFTNSSSVSEKEILNRLQEKNLPIPSLHHIISAGGILRKYMKDSLFKKKRIAFLGEEGLVSTFGEAAGDILNCAHSTDYDVLMILDDERFDFKASVDNILTTFFCRYRQNQSLPNIILVNPDMVYPSADGEVVFGPGIVFNMLNEVMIKILGIHLSVECLGKPGHHIFEEVVRRGTGEFPIIIGDQLSTDILGAKRFGIDAALITTGINTVGDIRRIGIQPDYLLNSLKL